ncbi:unnamed protein product [Schistocephalus solidus]|uniref:Protein kinase domain-containing protein n=1 Tax=Schistocephalus solidus TaxID=70667 RepID=A0A183T504_SCHSO|nr:unnamed protein product [Schistocephalus solidus]
MLSKFDDQIPEPSSRFYLAEMVFAIHSLHELGYVHRDIKSDNVLIESSGHIVLANFAAEGTHGTFGRECDYWSLGVVMFKILFWETSFDSEISRIMHFEKTFKIPNETTISADAKDLIERFICDRKQRIGRNNIREIMDR